MPTHSEWFDISISHPQLHHQEAGMDSGTRLSLSRPCPVPVCLFITITKYLKRGEKIIVPGFEVDGYQDTTTWWSSAEWINICNLRLTPLTSYTRLTMNTRLTINKRLSDITRGTDSWYVQFMSSCRGTLINMSSLNSKLEAEKELTRHHWIH